MSFILDALRKSETERQKAQVPGIGDAPMVVHQKHVPRWTVGLIACLSAGLVVLGWFWLRDAGTDTEEQGAAVSPTQATAGAAASSTTPTAPVAAMASAVVPIREIRNLSEEARQGSDAPAAAGAGNAPAPRAATPEAPEVPAVPMLTLAQYRASGGALPELNLELHVYSPTAAERFVFINSSKYVEGQTLAEGPRLGAITQDGAVLVHEGRSLLLPRE